MDEREKTSCGSPFSLGDGSWTEAKDGEKRAYVPGVGVKGRAVLFFLCYGRGESWVQATSLS